MSNDIKHVIDHSQLKPTDHFSGRTVEHWTEYVCMDCMPDEHTDSEYEEPMVFLVPKDQEQSEIICCPRCASTNLDHSDDYGRPITACQPPWVRVKKGQ